MNCPNCTKPMTMQTKTAYVKIGDKKWVYYTAEYQCESCALAFQTEAQLDADLEEIKRLKVAAAKLEKARHNYPVYRKPPWEAEDYL